MEGDARERFRAGWAWHGMCISGECGGEVEISSELDRRMLLHLDGSPGSVRSTGRVPHPCVKTDTDAGEIRSPPLKLS